MEPGRAIKNQQGFVGFEFYGCICSRRGDEIVEHKPVTNKIKSLLGAGIEVKIFTELAAEPYTPAEQEEFKKLIEEKCKEYFGRTLPITGQKSPLMYEYYDYKCASVECLYN